ncbi:MULTISPECIES: hypothetical protein [unclassified Neisseria]|nr:MULTISPECIES: hypothetical protein [unclassified Neisseria]MDO1510014.1 hypothetical protein [Neisseria sp. MVDL19-042950]MDO1516214.1 hypothetical protein [Neisseria sp. MVDL18-041461]MDO1563329.1 hypothetical protein [Neisseria sp. MVDL20-010259]
MTTSFSSTHEACNQFSTLISRQCSGRLKRRVGRYPNEKEYKEQWASL